MRFGSQEENVQNNEIHSSASLKHILEEERARSNRSNDVFSFVLFDLKELRGDEHAVSSFLSALSNRVRAIDNVGWMKEDSVGVVLPFTSSEGARKLSDEVLGNNSAYGENIRYTIYAYPHFVIEE